MAYMHIPPVTARPGGTWQSRGSESGGHRYLLDCHTTLAMTTPELVEGSGSSAFRQAQRTPGPSLLQLASHVTARSGGTRQSRGSNSGGPLHFLDCFAPLAMTTSLPLPKPVP